MKRIEIEDMITEIEASLSRIKTYTKFTTLMLEEFEELADAPQKPTTAVHLIRTNTTDCLNLMDSVSDTVIELTKSLERFSEKLHEEKEEQEKDA